MQGGRLEVFEFELLGGIEEIVRVGDCSWTSILAVIGPLDHQRSVSALRNGIVHDMDCQHSAGSGEELDEGAALAHSFLSNHIDLSREK